MENWKDIVGYEGLYQVSNLGNIKSLSNNKNRTEKLLSLCLTNGNYYFVYLYKKNKRKSFKVHQLVAIAFLYHIRCGYKIVVNHKNFNRQDNRVENLELVTQRENANKKHLKSKSKYTGVCWHKRIGKWHSSIRINNKKIHLGYFEIENEAHNAYQKKLKEITLRKTL